MAKPPLLVATWVGAAVAATAVALGALRFVGEQVAGLPPVLTAQAVASLAASVPPPTPGAPAVTSSPTPEPSTVPPSEPATVPASPEATRAVSSDGGTLAVTCRQGAPVLLYATPKAGYSSRVRDEGEGLDVRFRAGDLESRVRVTCAGSTPQVSVDERD